LSEHEIVAVDDPLFIELYVLFGGEGGELMLAQQKVFLFSTICNAKDNDLLFN
jgi:hypothetical protein